MIKRLFILSAIIAIWISSVAGAEQTVISVRVGVGETSPVNGKPPHSTILLSFVDDKGKRVITPPPLIITPAVENKSSYEVIGISKDGKREDLTVQEVTLLGRDSSLQRTATVSLLVKEDATKYDKVMVKVKDDVWAFPSSFRFVKKEEEEVPMKALQSERDYIVMRTLQNKFEMDNGSTIGVGSARYTYRYDNALGRDWLHIEAIGKADFNFRSQDRTKYFNSIVGELSGFYIDKANLFGRNFPYHVGIDANIESDQTFRNVDFTTGLMGKAYVNNPLTDWLYSLLVPDIKSKEAGLAPVFKLGYKYVDHIKEGVNTTTGSERLTADLYWSMPVARGWKLPEFVYKDAFDADFLIDVETAYAFEKSRFFDNSKLTLDFHSQVKPDKSPSFTLTYAQGKATPTFKHFDAFLAGVKLPF